MKTLKITTPVMAAGLAIGIAGAAQAGETRGTAYADGAESLGVAQLPPPGTYLLTYTNYYTADRLNDGDGDNLVPDFSLNAFANIARVVHVSDKTFLGATVAAHALIPVVNLDVKAGGQSQSNFGLGDIIVSPLVLGWKKGDWNLVATVDTFIPTGDYKAGDLANIGRNYWTFEPVFAATYAQPGGGWEASAKVMYDFNTTNDDTDYRSGQSLHTDAAVAYTTGKLTLGLTGYYYRQTTDDKIAGARVGPDGVRGEAFALGPLVRYVVGNVPVTAQWQHEFHAENRPQGDKFWVKAAFRF